jgi:uroporphyrinogen decarboxylase
MTTSRELVVQTLEFKNPERVPRQLWSLPWASIYHKAELDSIILDYPSDFGGVADGIKVYPSTMGDPYEIGEHIDIWGAKFINKQRGVIGEVKEPLITGENWEDAAKAHIPIELLAIDKDLVNKKCAQTDLFVMGGECPRPFEQLQFLRGTVELYMDLVTKPAGMFKFIDKMHDFYCQWVEVWAQTDVDGINMMDDWGSQNDLLIHPKTWKEIFRPMYREYIDIAKKYGKKTFMHSDGYTFRIIPELIDLGLDAFNTQIFCMGIDKLEQFKGKITFWGEIDRQHLLVDASPQEVKTAVWSVYNTLWAGGGCIAQCEFGAGAKPENVRAVFEAWDEVL